MNFDEYHKRAISTLTSKHAYGDFSAEFMAQVLGLIGESGEFADKVKKIIRDKDGTLSDEDRTEIAKELGDVLWYVNSLAHLLGTNLSDVAEQNLTKLASRKARGVLGGKGDNR